MATEYHEDSSTGVTECTILRVAGYSPSGRAVRASMRSLDHGDPEARLRVASRNLSGLLRFRCYRIATLSCFARGPAASSMLRRSPLCGSPM
jgi:hypothetical protein